ncbi:glucans biosynthesis glucosyltransferase MdoH [Falsirhodobacter algicola]|uniref:Glucans biosynthesis glucosyltransferase H n=1 Tax=Falsirhodobacter algicola TaxID=2692330 RepID=A0A8J8MSE3_9RHOB|nr:glucans biosynthesis glucosyltransferase MdoH [Falsirhodobacter algicola]QUS35343.1 glucans biosynthesis glucosyltransferase MdoH [Falsirhodobacter algicola]
MAQSDTRGHAAAARVFALLFSGVAAIGAFMLFLQFGMADGLDVMDIVRSVLILISTFWLAWGAAQAIMGLMSRAEAPSLPAFTGLSTKTAILVPVYNEDPVAVFARVAAMDASLKATGHSEHFHFAILSDTRKDDIAEQERIWFEHLMDDCDGEGRMFYRRRTSNAGRKAGNIEDFFQRSGAAYDFALILDADSLMAGDTIVEMARRMEAEPRLGLLQTLPKVTRAEARFGRAMQYSASFHSPIFARGLAMMQGETGPFWGHNAIVRSRAFAESCGLPELTGRPPFGGHVMSHDYVEAALLARAGWIVRLDDDLEGSFEEGPENIVDHAKRDRRWCQGNLQHAKIVNAPGLRSWNRFVFIQGILSYISPLFWLGFLISSITAPWFTPPINYFPVPDWPFPVFPSDETWKAIGLAVGIFGLLFLPKLLVAADAILSRRARDFGGAGLVLQSTLVELIFSSITAPILMMFQTRSVLQVIFGADSGWPTNNRGDGSLSLGESWAASWWIVVTGLVVLSATYVLFPGLVPWLLPIALPMIIAPLVICWTSRRSMTSLFRVPVERHPHPVMLTMDRILARWEGERDLTEAEAVAVPA